MSYAPTSYCTVALEKKKKKKKKQQKTKNDELLPIIIQLPWYRDSNPQILPGNAEHCGSVLGLNNQSVV